MSESYPSRLPETGFLRLRQIIGDQKADPPVTPLIPVGKTCWWEGVRGGRFPRPVKLGAGVTAWRVEDIRDLIASPERDVTAAPLAKHKRHAANGEGV